jgi:Putative adhesin
MKTHINPLALILLVAVASVVAANPTGRTTNAPPGTRDQIEKSFHVRPGGVLKFDADLANAEIITGDTDTVRIEFIREFKVSTSQEANELRQKLTVEMGQTDLTGTSADENTVKVTVRFNDDRQGKNYEKVRLDFRITMPRKFNLDLRTVGSATIGDLDGMAKASALGGSLRLGNVSGPVTAKSRGGSVTIGNVSGNVEVRSEGGSATIGRVNGRVVATAEGGSVSIEEATEAIEVRAAGGSVKAFISKQPRGDSKITAEAGNIELRLPESIAITVDAACTAGRLSSDFSLNGHQVDDPGRLKGVINGGGPLVMLRASAGNISLRK